MQNTVVVLSVVVGVGVGVGVVCLGVWVCGCVGVLGCVGVCVRAGARARAVLGSGVGDQAGVGWWKSMRALPGLLPEPRPLPAQPRMRSRRSPSWNLGRLWNPRDAQFSSVWSLRPPPPPPRPDREGRSARLVSPEGKQASPHRARCSPRKGGHRPAPDPVPNPAS